MNRRADRAIAVSAIAAVAIVPTVLIAAIQVGEASPKAAGEPAAAAAQNGPDGREPKSAAPTPSPTVSLAKPLTPPKLAPPVKPFVLHSYTRVTEGTLKRTPIGGRDRAKETSKIRLSPQVDIDTRAVHERSQLVLTKKTNLAMTVKGKTLSTYDGTRWTRSPLSKKQLDMVKVTNDPRLITFMVSQLPGAKKKGPNKKGVTHYAGKTTIGNILGFLPQGLGAAVFQVLPAKTPVYLHVWADAMGRPSVFTVSSSARTGTLNSRSTFRSYK